MEVNTFISPDEVVAEITPLCNDIEMRWRSKMYYYDLIKQALNELAFDTLYDERPIDYLIPSNCMIPLKPFTFNIKNVWLFSGEDCDQSTRVKVWHKRNMVTDGQTVFADVMDNSPESLTSAQFERESGTFFWNSRNGKLILSPSCKAYQKVRIFCNGAYDGNTPCIPIFVRQGVKDWAAKKAIQERMPEDPNLYKLMLAVVKDSYGYEFSGTWYEAQKRLSQLDAGAREDIKEYMGSIKYK